MNETIKIKNLKPDNARLIAGWCKVKDEDFLRQWDGNGYSYPLTEKQIRDRLFFTVLQRTTMHFGSHIVCI